MNQDEPICRGFLAIGDQHLKWTPPGRRVVGYWRDVMLKIKHSIDVANQLDLVPLFEGDLFDVPRDNPDELKTIFLDIISKSRHRPIANVGNHDIGGAKLSAADSLGVIAKSGHIRVMATGGAAATFIVDGRRILVGASPYGQPIPKSIEGLGGDVDARIWLTHHDLAFAGMYPGATDIFQMDGCDLVLNGHMHLYRDPVPFGMTTWCNFGAIARTSIDAINEVPSAFEVRPDEKGRFTFTRHELPHRPASEVFNMIGLQITAADIDNDAVTTENGDDAGVADGNIPALSHNEFVSMMQSDLSQGGQKTSSGAVIRDMILARMREWETEPLIRQEIISLMDEVTEPSP